MTTETSARAEAQQHAGEVKDTVQEQTGRVTGTAAEQTREVAQDALDRAKDLGGELRTTVSRETGEQRDRIVEAIRGFAGELDAMSSGSEQSGLAAQATSTVADGIRRFADSVDGSTGTDLTDSLRSFARRKPVTFLAGAALAGVVVGRFVRGAQAGEPGTGSRPVPAGSGSPAFSGYTPEPAAARRPIGSGYTPGDTGTSVGAARPAVVPEPLPPQGDRELGEVHLLGTDDPAYPQGRV